MAGDLLALLSLSGNVVKWQQVEGGVGNGAEVS